MFHDMAIKIRIQYYKPALGCGMVIYCTGLSRCNMA